MTLAPIQVPGSSNEPIRLEFSGGTEPIEISVSIDDYVRIEQPPGADGPAILLAGTPGPPGDEGPPGPEAEVTEGDGIEVVGNEVRLDIPSLPLAP